MPNDIEFATHLDVLAFIVLTEPASVSAITHPKKDHNRLDRTIAGDPGGR